MGLIAAAVTALVFVFWRRQRQPQTFAGNIRNRGSDALDAVGNFLPSRQQNRLITRGMETLRNVTNVRPRQRQSRWERLTERVLG